MLFPLGLGLNFPRTPYLTVLLSVALIGYYAFDYPQTMEVSTTLKAIVSNPQLVSSSKALYVEYCAREKGEPTYCEKVAQNFADLHRGKAAPLEKKEEKAKTNAKGLQAKFQEGYQATLIFKRFLKELSSGAPSLESLATYPAYTKAKDRMEEELADLQERYQLFSASNPDWIALFKAQFKHAGVAHLLSNLFAFIVFGSYVELRIGAALFFLIYLAGGTVGLGFHISSTNPRCTLWAPPRIFRRSWAHSSFYFLISE